MSTDEDPRIAQLRRAAQRKHDDATAKAKRAIVALENRGRPVNFTSVAATAGVSKDFLYKHAELRHTISNKRGSAPVRTPSRGAAPSESVTVKLQVASEALRRLRAENAALRAENARLRGDLLALRRP